MSKGGGGGGGVGGKIEQAKGIGYNAWWRFDCGSACYAFVVIVVAVLVAVAAVVAEAEVVNS